MGAEKLLQKLTENNVLVLATVFNLGLRELGWYAIKFLATVVNGLESSVTKIYSLNGFFSSDEITKFIDKYKPLIWIILTISLAIIGFKIMMNRKKNRGEIPGNILISLAVIILLPTIMMKMNEATNLIVNDNISKYSSAANEIVKNNLSDLYYLDEVKFNLNGKKNNIPAKDILNIDIDEKLDSGSIKNDKDAFSKKLITDKDGKIKTKSLDKSWFFPDENYYRYNLNFTIVIATLCVTAITLACCSIKIARIIFELAFHKIFATIMAFADIGDGRKLKEIIKDIGSMFAILAIISILLKLYIIFSGWIGSTLTDSSLEVAKMILLVGASLSVIDGPNIIEKIFGIDAGIKSNWQTLMAGYAATKGVATLGKSVGKTLFNVGKKAAVAGAGLGGIAGGVLGGAKGKNKNKSSDSSLENEMNNSKTKTSPSTNNNNNSLENEMKKANGGNQKPTLEGEMKKANG